MWQVLDVSYLIACSQGLLLRRRRAVRPLEGTARTAAQGGAAGGGVRVRPSAAQATRQSARIARGTPLQLQPRVVCTASALCVSHPKRKCVELLCPFPNANVLNSCRSLHTCRSHAIREVGMCATSSKPRSTLPGGRTRSCARPSVLRHVALPIRSRRRSHRYLKCPRASTRRATCRPSAAAQSAHASSWIASIRGRSRCKVRLISCMGHPASSSWSTRLPPIGRKARFPSSSS
mmetsp:Transcript_66248/g.181651  ORF Transcript_66248/g.181651 Transcript_66248/m.181651 type:complete len:234 (+) Transcript_66248:721-1422(+)